jgi:hypothetical protein
MSTSTLLVPSFVKFGHLKLQWENTLTYDEITSPPLSCLEWKVGYKCTLEKGGGGTPKETALVNTECQTRWALEPIRTF